VTQIDATQCSTSLAPDVYFVLACADDLMKRIEGDESNNCRASNMTTLISP
jgi:hypothetical protein